MKFTTKEYIIIKTKNYAQKIDLFFFFNGVNRNFNDWIILEQGLNKIKFNYYKVFDKTSRKILNTSIYSNVSALINGLIFFLKPLSNNRQEITKQNLLNDFEPLFFTLLALKLNNKIYSTNQLKIIWSFNYHDNPLLFFKFGLTNLKLLITVKNSNNKYTKLSK